MRHLSLALVAAVSTIALTQIASAADMPTKAPIVQAPAPAPQYNWTGCYIGGNAGGAWSRSNIDIPLYPSNVDAKASGFMGGVQAGCNYMFPSRWVVGIEGDWDWTRLNGSTLTVTVPGESYFTNWNSLATVRGRAGYAWDNFFLYGTGGAAFAHLNGANYIPNCGVNCATDRTATYSGWVAGIGVEYAIYQNWIVGLEYLHAQFGRKNFVYNGPTNVDERMDVVRARLSYKFF